MAMGTLAIRAIAAHTADRTATIARTANSGDRMMQKFLFAMMIALPAALSQAQGTGSQQMATPASPPASRNAAAPPSLPISFGDLIQITVFDSPDLSESLRVNQSGDVVLPLGGAVHVQG